jgi:hypothetical protein
VNWRTIGAMRHPPWGELFLVGSALVAILWFLLAVPCERGDCLLPGDTANVRAAAHAALPTDPLPDSLHHCPLHCGMLLVPLLLVLVTPGLLARLPVRIFDMHVFVTAPPPLPPPQAV